MKKILAMLLAAGMALSLAACGGNGPAASTDKPSADPGQSQGDTTISGSYTIRLGTPTGGKHQQNVTMEKFKEEIEAASNGAITVELYPTSQLGTAPQMIEGVQNGTIEGVLIPSSYFASYAPAIAVLDLPFLFESDGTAAAKAQQILSAGTGLDEYLYDRGFKVGGYLLGGNQYILSTFPIEKIGDFKGHKLWTLPSSTLQNSLNAYGASSNALDPSEVAAGLQNGTIDGVLNDCTFWLVQGLYESAKCINLCPAGAFVNCFFFSADWYDELPANVQELVISTARRVIDEYEIPYMTEYSESAMQTMLDAGCVQYTPSEELLNAMKDATADLRESFKSTDADCEVIYNEFVSLIGAGK